MPKLIGFDKEKSELLSRQLSSALKEISKHLNRPINPPAVIYAMSSVEVKRKVSDGLWDTENKEARVNSTLPVEDILQNIVRVILQKELPSAHSLKVTTLVKEILSGLQLMEKTKSLHTRVMEALNKKLIKRLRSGKKKTTSTVGNPTKYLPGLIGNNDSPWNPSQGYMRGPASFGPVSVGGIMRHS